MSAYDMVIRGGTVVTAADTMVADVGIQGGRIVRLGDDLAAGAAEIDARGHLVMPGGIDSHCHMDQPLYGGAQTADDFLTGTRSAACGGTTTVMPFAYQEKGGALRPVVEATVERARGKACIDFALHMVIADPSPSVLGQELPALIEDGYTSFKIYLTYDSLKLADREVLETLAAARREGAMAMIHAENHEAIGWLTEALDRAGFTHPKYLATARPAPVESEACNRALLLAEIAGQPVLIVHVSAKEAAATIRRAKHRGLPVFGETCPQYLFLSQDDLDIPGFEAAKFMCCPPPREAANQEHIWRGIADGTFDVFSSDHAPYSFDGPLGKKAAGADAPFHKIAPGLPGLETRLPLLFSEGVGGGRIDLQRFVALAATNAARIYGLYPRKGSLVVGADADIAIWDPGREVTITNDILHHAVDYTPYEGRRVTGWPVITLARGVEVCREFAFTGTPGAGQNLPCARPLAAVG